VKQSPEANRDYLFFSSCIAIIATAMTFGIRAEIMDALAAQFRLNHEQLGWIAGTAFWGFTVSMLIGGQLCDRIGMKRLIQLAFIAHLLGLATTIWATGFSMLFAGTLSIGLGNGLVEAAANPLMPTLYPANKTERLNRMHVWFPGGIVIGGLVAVLLGHFGFNWQVKMGSILVPTVAYGALFFREKLPATECARNNVPASIMYAQALRPGFLILLFCILLTAATELGPSQWIPSILTKTTGFSGIFVLVWITGLEAIGRRFAGEFVKRIAPTALLIMSTMLSAIGLFGLGMAENKWSVMTAATIYAVGICYCWPTMYGITSERFPAGGAFLLALIGSAGMLSDAFVVPVMGHMYDAWGPGATLRTAAILPCVVTTIFAGIWLYDRSHGGYRIVLLDGPHGKDEQSAVIAKEL
jgi:fucose permease